MSKNTKVNPTNDEKNKKKVKSKSDKNIFT